MQRLDLSNCENGRIRCYDNRGDSILCKCREFCYMDIRRADNKLSFEYNRGCTVASNEIEKDLMDRILCSNILSVNTQRYAKCCNTSLCNGKEGLEQLRIESKFTLLNEDENSINWYEIFGYVSIGIPFIIFLVLFYRFFSKSSTLFNRILKINGSNSPAIGSEEKPLKLNEDDTISTSTKEQNISYPWEDRALGTSCNHKMDNHNFAMDMTSGSGSGQARLTARTIAHDIVLDEKIGQGRFGTVYKGTRHGEEVAVKIFSSISKASFEQEAFHLRIPQIYHPNVLRLIATDSFDTNTNIEFWIVTEFHSLGSLHDYINSVDLNLTTAFELLRTAADGLAHLHRRICGFGPNKLYSNGSWSKPAIAHRDIKSQNILVKSDLTCCIGDLGMCVAEIDNLGNIEPNIQIYSGTRRYMAPEILQHMAKHHIGALMAADVYSFALVMWELMNSCVIPNEQFSIDSNEMVESEETGIGKSLIPNNNHLNIVSVNSENSRLPYADHVGNDPSTEEMIKCVCANERPKLRNCNIPNVRLINETIRESWITDPNSRISSQRIAKSLNFYKKSKLNGKLPTENSLKHYFNDDFHVECPNKSSVDSLEKKKRMMISTRNFYLFALCLLLFNLFVPSQARYLSESDNDLALTQKDKRFFNEGFFKNIAKSAIANAIVSKLMGGSARRGAKHGAMMSGVWQGVSKVLGKKK
ncbi:hypothetical protein SNEBB_011031 [Seison nebaliae]|nr:hypothetical protein SNEBB_011031 [Seison nebaliae]